MLKVSRGTLLFIQDDTALVQQKTANDMATQVRELLDNINAHPRKGAGCSGVNQSLQ
jgi:hypothetical protein